MNCYICKRAMPGDQSGACARCKEAAVHSALQATANAIRPANKPKPRYWLGSTPTQCQVCTGDYQGKMVDGALHTGQWALMCGQCHRNMGRGLGMGRGQKYTRQADGRWLKTGG
jgi:hypothetical protein